MFDYKKNPRPLLFKEESTEYPYSLGGTCFLFCYENFPYIISAKHCFCNRDISSLTVIIDPWQASDHHYPFSFTSPFRTLPCKGQPEDSDSFDVIYYPVNLQEFTPPVIPFFYPFSKVFEDDFELSFGREIFVAGYPDPAHDMDYEKEIYSSALVTAQAINIIPNNDHMFELKLAPNSLSTYRGFSGSPVYSYNRKN